MSARGTIEMPTEKANLQIRTQRTNPSTDSLARESRKLALAVLTQMSVQHFERAKEFPLIRRENLLQVNMDDEQALSTTTDFMRVSAQRIFGDSFDENEWNQTMLSSSGDMKQGVAITPSASPYAAGMLKLAMKGAIAQEDFYSSYEYLAAQIELQSLRYVAAQTYLKALQEQKGKKRNLQIIERPFEQEERERKMAERLAIFGQAQGLSPHIRRLERIAKRIQTSAVKEHRTLTNKSVLLARNLDAYARAHYTGEKHTLRERQMDVYDDIQESVERGETEGYVDAPTGFGKTVLFGEVVAAADMPTVIVVPRKRLVEQTYESLKRFNPDLSVGRVYSDKKEYGHQVIITTYQTVTSDTEREKIPFKKAGLVILDEVDVATGKERIKALENIPEDTFVLGVSATPVKVGGQDFSTSRVARLLNNEIHAITIREAIEEGNIASFSNYVVEVGTDISSVSITEGGNYNEDELEQIINNESHNKAAVDFFLEVRQRDRNKQLGEGKTKFIPLTTSVYAASVQHAKDLASEFRKRGVKAQAVWGRQNPSEQNEIMRQWAAGEIEVVVSKDLLVRGNDIPKIRFVENVAPTASPGVAKQRGGRGLRLDEENLDKHTIISDFVYRNTNRYAPQITFAWVAGAGALFRMVYDRENRTDRTQSEKLFLDSDFHIQGLTVKTDVHEVMRITKEIRSQKEVLLEAQETDFAVTQVVLNSTFVGGYVKLKPLADQVIAEIRKKHPELLVKRQSLGIPIDAITDREFFIQMMVDKGARIKDTTVKQVQEGDTVINANFINALFVGGHAKISPISQAVIDEMRLENPESVATRKNKNATTTVVIDLDTYLDKMQAKGVEQKVAKQEVAQNEVAITNTWLNSAFIGDVIRIRSVVDVVIADLGERHPELVRWQRSSNARIPIIADIELFFDEMRKRNISQPDLTIAVIEDSDIPMTSTYLLTHFQGRYEIVKAAKDVVIAELQAERPDLVRRKRKGNQGFTVVTDEALFTEKMLARGIQLKEK